MSLLKLLTPFALVVTVNVAVADNIPIFENGTLAIPVVSTENETAKYEHVRFQLAKDGRWNLIDFSEPVQATIDEIIIDPQIRQTFPIQIQVTVKGHLPNGCFGLGETHVVRKINQFNVVINRTELDTLVACTQALVPFEIVVPLDVVGLNSGVYQVNVNGIDDSFELLVDNF